MILKNSKLIVTVVLCFIVIGCTTAPFNVPNNNGSRETGRNVVSPAQRLADILCQQKREKGLLGYGGAKILNCGEYYKLQPPRDLEDAPSFILDADGNEITYCGGMPGPVPREIPQECYLECSTTGLSLCSTK